MKTTRETAPAQAEGCVLKVCGADVELGNFVLGVDTPDGSGAIASRALLRAMEGTPRATTSSSQSGRQPCASWGCNDEAPFAPAYGFAQSYDPQDWGRKYLPANGGCVYVDLDHLEICLPEVTNAFEHVAAWHAMLRLVRQAQQKVNAGLRPGQRIQVLANNSDGRGNSYGGHMNFLVTRRCFDNLFKRKLHHMLYLASYLASSIIFTGAGKVGSENRRPPVNYQLSQRADFYETLTGPQTTHHRPIVNSRDEALCGPAGAKLARLHVIFFDSALNHVSSLLKVGVTQVLLAMIEQEHVASRLILDEPVKATVRWSHDPSLRVRAALASGASYTAIELQEAIFERACRFVATGRAEGVVPRVTEIMALWEDTLRKLRQRDMASLARRLDWALKLCAIDRAMARHGLGWDSPQVKHLDHLYSSLDADEGLYWAFARAGAVDNLVTEGQIERFVHEPPEDTRAWCRAHLLRRAAPEAIDDVDWDSVSFKLARGTRGSWPSYSYVSCPMPDPLAFTRRQCEAVFARAGSLEELLKGLGAVETSTPLIFAGDEEDLSPTRPRSPCEAAGASPKTNSVALVPLQGRSRSVEDKVIDVRDASTVGLKRPPGPIAEGGKSHGVPRKDA